MADRYDDQIVTRWGGKTARQVATEAVVAPAFLRLLQAKAAAALRVPKPARAATVAPPRAPSGTPDVSDAIKVGSVAEEYAFLSRQRCACRGTYQRETQTVLEMRGLHYDQLDMRCAKCGAGRTFLFDINAFFAKRP